MAGQGTRLQVKILNGESLSGEIDLSQYRVVGIQVPPAWTAAALTFQGRASIGALSDDTTPALGKMVDDAGNEITVPSAAMVANQMVMLTSDVLCKALAGSRHIKVRSGTAGTPVNQAADRTLVFIVEPLGV